MSNIQFQTSDAVENIQQALDDFLRNKKLNPTPQQYQKLKKLLMVVLLEEDLTYENAYNQLTEIFEYRTDYEIDANAPNEAQEEMIRIIGAADIKEKEIIVETSRFKKRFIIASIILVSCLTILVGTKTIQHFKTQTIEMASVITKKQEEEIKYLVQQIVELERERGHNITHNAIYNQIKNLESIQAKGSATSYKKFNNAQLKEAKKFLNESLKTAEQDK